MANTKDLRYVRTEAAIRSAFMSLVAEMPAASVTVSNVCQRAGISRNAFYLHHTSASGLYAALVEELVEDVRAESLASAERRAETGHDDALLSLMLDALARHEDTLRALLPSDDGSLAKCLAEGIEESFVQAALRFGEHGGSFEHRLRCAYAAWAIVGMTVRWIAETDRPLNEALADFEELHASVVEVSANYLLGNQTKAR